MGSKRAIFQAGAPRWASEKQPFSAEDGCQGGCFQGEPFFSHIQYKWANEEERRPGTRCPENTMPLENHENRHTHPNIVSPECNVPRTLCSRNTTP